MHMLREVLLICALVGLGGSTIYVLLAAAARRAVRTGGGRPDAKKAEVLP